MLFHLFLEGEEDGAAPEAWLISRLCEEFGCRPSEALDEPAGLTLEIMELRAYARAKAELEAAQKEEDVPRTPMVERVWEVQGEIWKRRQAQGTGRNG